MRLRSKLAVTLVAVSLASAAMVGGIAYWLLMRDFGRAVEEQAFLNFQSDVTAYLALHGSWEAGQRVEPFPRYVERLRGAPNGPFVPGELSAPSVPSLVARGPRAPFRFALADPHGTVIKAAGHFALGDVLPPSVGREARPIAMNGRVALLAVPVGEPNLSDRDLSYLAALREALVTGVLAAGSLAALVGFVFGRRASAALDELTGAVGAMRADGELLRPLAVRSSDEFGKLAAAFNRMSAELAAAHAEMRELSIRDPLTHLYNRRHFDEHAARLYEQAVRYGQPVAVMVGDLDDFKGINDRHSHAVGDEVLRRVASILGAHTRRSDIVARIGGEEFAIVYAQTALADAARKCEELRCLVAAYPWHEIVPDLRVTMSMGLSADTAQGSVEKMLGVADARLYEAKRAGRNRVVSGPVAAGSGGEALQAGVAEARSRSHSVISDCATSER